HRGNAHERAVAGRRYTCLVPRRAAPVASQRFAHGLPDAEDGSARELARQRIGFDAPTPEQAAQRPDRELRVVGRQPDGAAARVAIRHVIAYTAAVCLAAQPWRLPLGGVTERVAERES